MPFSPAGIYMRRCGSGAIYFIRIMCMRRYGAPGLDFWPDLQAFHFAGGGLSILSIGEEAVDEYYYGLANAAIFAADAPALVTEMNAVIFILAR